MNERLLLNDGHDIPKVGSLSFHHGLPKETAETISKLLNIGNRHFEVSGLFDNGHIIMDTIRKSKIPRSEIYITWKLWAKDVTATDMMDKFKQSLKLCQLDYVDLLILNDPIDRDVYMDLYRSLEQLKEEGYAKSLGVSKISVSLLLDIIRKSYVSPAVFETEMSPFNYNKELIGYCEDNCIVVMSSELFSKGLRTKNPTLINLAQNHGVTKEEIIYRWAESKKLAVLLPRKSKLLSHLQTAESVVLDSETVDILDSLNESLNTLWMPSAANTNDE